MLISLVYRNLVINQRIGQILNVDLNIVLHEKSWDLQTSVYFDTNMDVEKFP